MSEHDKIHKQLFGSKEVDDFKEQIIKDLGTIEEYTPEHSNVTIDNVSVSCSDVVLAAKIVALLIINNVNKNNYSQADCDALFNDLKYSLDDVCE